jgi:hypothetical protein
MLDGRITMMDDARTEETKQEFKRSSQISGHSRLFMHARRMLLAVIALSVMNVGVTLADDQPLPSMTIGYQNGTITAIYENTLEIDGRSYGLMPDVVMLDEHERMLDPGRLVVTAEVKFHVKKEQSNMIDKMIVTLPK